MRIQSILVVLVLLCVPALAQTTQHSSKVSVPDDLIARQQISEGEEALGQGDIERAIQEWQTVLDRFPTKVVQAQKGPRTLGDTDQVVPGDVFRGIRGAVFERLLALSSEGAEAYQKLYAKTAAEDFQTAWNIADIEGLRRVASRFLLTPAGKMAAFAVNDSLLEQGRFEEARVHARRLGAQLSRIGADANLLGQALAREAMAYSGMGDHQSLTALRERVSKAEHTVALADGEQALTVWIDRLLGQLPAPAASHATHPSLSVLQKDDWSIIFNRNRNELDGWAVGFENWRALRQEPYVIYPVVPTIADGTVYYSDGMEVAARSLFSGELQWRPVLARVPKYAGRPNPNLQHHVVLDGDLLFASLEDDTVMRSQTSWQGFRPIESIPSRKLIAINSGTGEVIWNHAHPQVRDPADREFLGRFTVNQPPCVVGDTVYVAGTFLLGVYHHWVCAFERDTGILRWRTYIGSGQQELNMFGNPIKEGMPGGIIEHEGRLFYSTNIGTCAALDAVDGTILWLSAYEQEPIPTTDRTDTRERAPGWMPGRPAIWKNRVFFAPADSYFVYAADQDTGKLTPVRASQRTRRRPYRHFLGIHEGSLILAGNIVTAINPDTLRLKWRTIDLSVGGMGAAGTILGRPAAVGRDLVFTTRSPDARQRQNCAAYLVDLENGRVRSEQVILGREREGNVAIASDGFVVAGTTSVRSFVDHDEVARRLERMTATERTNPDMLMRLGDVQVHRSRWGAALASYAAAFEAAREQGPRARGLTRRAQLALYNGWMRVALDPQSHRSTDLPSATEERFAKAKQYALSDGQRIEATYRCFLWAFHERRTSLMQAQADDLLAAGNSDWITLDETVNALHPQIHDGTRAPGGVAALLIMASHAARAGNAAEAVGYYHRLQTDFPSVSLGRRLALDYAGTEIESLIHRHGRAVYSQLEREAKALLEGARERKDLQALRSIVTRYPQSQQIETVYLELARGLAAAGEHAAAALEMNRYFVRQGGTSAEGLWEGAQAMEQLGAHESARQFLRILAASHPSATIPTADGPRPVKAAVDRALAAPVYSGLDDQPVVRLAPRPRPGLKIGSPDGAERLRLYRPEGRQPATAAGIVFLHFEGALRATSIDKGETLWAKAAMSSPMAMRWHDGQMITELDGELVVLDPVSGAERWRRKIDEGSLHAFAVGHGRVHCAVATVTTRAMVVLVTLDLATGEEISRASFPGAGEEVHLEVGTRTVAMFVPNSREVHCLDALSGQLLPSYTLERGAPAPRLTADDAIVLTFGAASITRNAAKVARVVARDIRTGEDRWAYRELPLGITRVIPVTGRWMVLSHILRGRGKARLIVLDLETGRPRIERQFGRNSTLIDARVLDDRLFATVRSGVGASNRSAYRIEAYDLQKGVRLWNSSEFGDADLRVAVTEDWVLVMKTPPGSFGKDDQHAEIYFVGAKSGRTEDFLDLGPVAGWAEADLIVHPQGLAASTGTQLLTFLPREG